MRGSIAKPNDYHSLQLMFDQDEVKYLTGSLPKSVRPRLSFRGTIGEGIVVRFSSEGIAMKEQPNGSMRAYINVARIEAISTQFPLEPFPSTRVLDEGCPALRLAPQPKLSAAPDTPERVAIPGPESRTPQPAFNPIPLAEAQEPAKVSSEPPLWRQPARPGIAAGLSKTAVQNIAQRHSTMPITLEPNGAARAPQPLHPHTQPHVQARAQAAQATQPVYMPKPTPVPSPDSIVTRVKDFWKQEFDVLTLALNDKDIWDLYKAHGQPEFGKFLEIIKAENDAITVKAPPAPQSTDKIADLKTAMEMVNTLLDEIGPTVSVKVDPETHRLVARRVKVVEEEL